MNKRTFLLLCAAALVAGCTDDSGKSSTACNPPCGDGETCVDGVCQPDMPADPECAPPCGDGETCVEGVCQPNAPADPECDPPCGDGETCVEGVCKPDMPADPECNPPCGDAEICVNGTCESVCKPACDPVRQKCDANTRTCVYIKNYCEPGTCSPDKLRVCSADGDNPGTWGECPDGETCFHGTCLPELPTECINGICNDLNQACIDGSWHQCSDAETCSAGQCNPNVTECTPGTCLENDNSYMCGKDGTPVKCEAGQVCDNGQCIIPANKNKKLLWTICNVNSDCSYGSCVKNLTLSRETADPDNPDVMIKTVPVSRLDSRIPEGRGVCSADCTKDASICNYLSLGDKHFSCQLVFEGLLAYPPKGEDGNDLELPFVNELDIDEMAKGVPFAAMCRPFIQNSAYPEDFTKPCLKDSDCTNGTKCVGTVCTVPCADESMCPLTFQCTDDAEFGKFCQPASETYSACRDKDGDGYGVGICTHSAVDCDDRKANTFYTTDAPKICSEYDTNCNGRIDRYELLGSPEHCNACNDLCKMPTSDSNMSRVCYKNNGDAELDDYDPDTYVFECVKSCVDGFADCDGNSSNGCELNIIEASNNDNSTYKIYSFDADGDGFGSNKDGNIKIGEKDVYDKNHDDRAFCCGSQCYGYVKSANPSITDKLWSKVDITTGYSETRTDCNDANPDVHPDAKEICDGIDNNCSGKADEDNFYNADGQLVESINLCNTGKQGICAAGKTVCENINDTYTLYCKADHDAESFEFCNEKRESEDCDEYVDEGYVAIDLNGKPIKVEGKGYQMVDASQDAGGVAANHICAVDPKEFPDAKGKCMFGRWTCDPDRAKSGKETVYCKPFDPDPVDFIGDNYDANCDGFDGDLKHTLFISNIDYSFISKGSDDQTYADLKQHSNDKVLHKHPLATLKKAAQIVNECKDGFGCHQITYHLLDADAPAEYFDTLQQCNNKYKTGCVSYKIGWDIVINSNTYDNQALQIPASSIYSADTMKLADYRIMRLNDVKNPTEFIKSDAIPHLAWLRVYGNAQPENINDEVIWKFNNRTTTMKFKLNEDEFYHKNILSIIDTSAQPHGSLYIKDMILEAIADDNITVDATKSANKKSPATLVGINANKVDKIEIDNVQIHIKAPKGRDGEDGIAAGIKSGTKNLSGISAEWVFSDSYTHPDFSGAYSRGYMLDKTNHAPGTKPTCTNGSYVNPGYMGGYTELTINNDDEYNSYFNIKNGYNDYSEAEKDLISSRIVRMYLGTINDGVSEFGHSYGIDGYGNKNVIAPKIRISENAEYTSGNSYWNTLGDVGLCVKVKAPNEMNILRKDYFNSVSGYVKCEDKTTMMHVSYITEEKDKPSEYPYYPLLNAADLGKPEGNFYADQKVVRYKNTLLFADSPYNDLDYGPSGDKVLGGIVNNTALNLYLSPDGIYFQNTQEAYKSDGNHGHNGYGGAGMPPVLFPASIYQEVVYINGLGDPCYGYLKYGASWYPTAYHSSDHDFEKYKAAYSIKQYFSQLYRHYISQYYLQNEPGKIRDNRKRYPFSIYMMGASGGAGGCGGVAGKGGRPGASAIGIAFTPSSDVKSILNIHENSKITVIAGDGGKGGRGSDGASGYDGGMQLMQVKSVNWNRFKGKPKNDNTASYTPDIKPGGNGQKGQNGDGGSGGAGAQGGYAMGVIVNCHQLNAPNYAECMKKMDIHLPKNIASGIETTQGKHGFVPKYDTNGSPIEFRAEAGGTRSSTDVGKGGQATPMQTERQKKEIINGNKNDLQAVYSSQPLSFIYGVSGNKAQLGTKEKK